MESMQSKDTRLQPCYLTLL